MGCASSTEAGAVVVVAKDNAIAGVPPTKPNITTTNNEKHHHHHHHDREKKRTEGTETMAVSSHDNNKLVDTTDKTTATTTTDSAGAAAAAAAATAVKEGSSNEISTTTTATSTTKEEASSTSAEAAPPAPAAAAPSSDTVTVGNLRIRYGCLSKKGRDPDDSSKPNQDCYGVFHHSPSDSGSSATGSGASFFAGVYDGHGPHGQPCSKFVEQRLPDIIQKNFQANSNNNKSKSLSVHQIQDSLHKAHAVVNDELRAASHINDSYSGTTSISAYIHSSPPENPNDHGTTTSRITVCNVGDSRAILGTQTTKTKLTAVPLSRDQTPHRQDEAERCIRSGARILSFGQIDPNTKSDDDDSDVEDPPRVWSKKGKYPGTAFTRSIGDAVAEKLGVYAEPEILTIKLSSKEKVVVLASDGIFDVMENQQVINICHSHIRDNNDPLQACQAIIKKSHEEWLLNEECLGQEESASYDDMTLICIFIEDKDQPPPPVPSTTTTTTTTPEPQQQQQQLRHSKRVRQKTLRNLEEME